MARGGWLASATAAVALAAALTAAALAAPVSAEPVAPPHPPAAPDAWQSGPVTRHVAFDTSSVAAGIAPADITRIDFGGAVCWTPDPVEGEWTGDGVTVTVDDADTEALSCAVIATVRYCEWVLGRRDCTAVRSEDVRASGDPLHVDAAKPEVTGARATDTHPNADGWFRTPGVIRWTGRDDASGIAECTVVALGGGDTWRRIVRGTCRDRAGNAAEEFAYTYRFDATPPVLAPTTGGPVGLGMPAGAHPGAVDETSGVRAAICNGGAPLTTSTMGEHSVTCAAEDHAGNTASASTTYTVGYGFAWSGGWTRGEGFRAARVGQSIALGFRLTTDLQGGVERDLDLSAVTARTMRVPCVPSAAAAGGGRPRAEQRVAVRVLDLGDGEYTLVWSAPPAFAGSCRLLSVDVGDGVPHTMEFAFR